MPQLFKPRTWASARGSAAAEWATWPKTNSRLAAKAWADNEAARGADTELAATAALSAGAESLGRQTFFCVTKPIDDAAWARFLSEVEIAGLMILHVHSGKGRNSYGGSFGRLNSQESQLNSVWRCRLVPMFDSLSSLLQRSSTASSSSVVAPPFLLWSMLLHCRALSCQL